MAKNHNKKRNIGIIYEQIINYVCNSLIEENKSNAEAAINIIKTHFTEKSQLRKEYKLFKALSETQNVSGQLASQIITEAKKACNYMFDSKVLEEEKSYLIKDLNYTIGKGIIFEEKVKNYRKYATIQTLLNEWRSEVSSFDKTTEYEIKLHESLTQKNPVIENNFVPQKVDKLTYKIMNEMFDKKYKTHLNDTQKEIITLYIEDNDSKLEEKYQAVKESCDFLLERYIEKCNNEILKEKYLSVKANINKLNTGIKTKENLQKFLTIGKLKEEVLGE
jgi:hypothetical protein